MMLNLFIPPLGTEIELAEDWRFRLHDEYRNAKMINLLAPKLPTRTIDGFWDLSPHEQLELMNKSGWMIESGKFRSQSDIGIYASQKFAYVTLPAGTKLKVQRIYIRQGQKSFDSVTFSVTGLPADIAEREPRMGKKKPSALGRFWVKLDDANKIKLNPI